MEKSPTNILLALLCVPLVLVVRLIRPLIRVRFGNLRNHTIGTYSLHAEGYMADRDMGLLPPRTLDIFYHTEPRANRVLDRLIERRLHVWQFARYCSAVNANIPGGAPHVVTLGDAERDGARNHFLAYTQTPQHFSLTATEIAEARRQLKQHCGIPDDAKSICFFSRTSSYLRELHKDGTIRRPEEIPTHNIRDSAIETFLPAAEELARRGYWCFRMGAVVDQAIPCKHERVIDYAGLFRSELLDIYLISHCDLILSDTTGLADLCWMFRRPSATANYVALRQIRTWDGVFMPKKYYFRATGKMLTAREIFLLGLDAITSAGWSQQAETLGVTAHDNSAEEITELALETLARSQSTWVDTPEDIERQEAFRRIIQDNQPLAFGGPPGNFLATTFLRRHPDYIR